MHRVFASRALLPTGWAERVTVTIAPDGAIAAVETGAAPDARASRAEHVAGVLLPGMPNLHSHAFQRAMAGLGERAAEATGPGAPDIPPALSPGVSPDAAPNASPDAASAAGNPADSFWTWREVMYGFVSRLEPDDVQAIAAQLYLEMVTAGYTGVAEFHYLHHAPDGRPYADRATMAMAVVAAAREIGIGLTLLPVLYMTGGFGGAPPKPTQRRFLHTCEGFAALLADLQARLGNDPQLCLGMAAHSLRAVPPEALARVLSDLDGDAGLGALAPIHVHVAEQQQEVADCLAWSGQRPVAWLLDHAPVGPRWCLVHATHMTPHETRALARSGAVAGLCPTTEANLGDGLFPLATYLEAGGRLGIGSDSHVSVSPIAELRWLEYGQRLVTRSRNVAARASAAERSTGARLYRKALAGGAQALGRRVGAIAAGQRADFIFVDDQHPRLYGRSGDLLLDALVFSGEDNPVRDVMIGGAWVVRNGVHAAAERVQARFRRTMDRLLA
jgi:formimidoylglutamate deiminase